MSYTIEEASKNGHVCKYCYCPLEDGDGFPVVCFDCKDKELDE